MSYPTYCYPIIMFMISYFSHHSTITYSEAWDIIFVERFGFVLLYINIPYIRLFCYVAFIYDQNSYYNTEVFSVF